MHTASVAAQYQALRTWKLACGESCMYGPVASCSGVPPMFLSCLSIFSMSSITAFFYVSSANHTCAAAPHTSTHLSSVSHVRLDDCHNDLLPS